MWVSHPGWDSKKKTYPEFPFFFPGYKTTFFQNYHFLLDVTHVSHYSMKSLLWKSNLIWTKLLPQNFTEFKFSLLLLSRDRKQGIGTALSQQAEHPGEARGTTGWGQSYSWVMKGCSRRSAEHINRKWEIIRNQLARTLLYHMPTQAVTEMLTQFLLKLLT